MTALKIQHASAYRPRRARALVRSVYLLILIAACDASTDPKARAPSTTGRNSAHHRTAGTINLDEATALMPRFDATTLVTPYVTPQLRVMSRFCFPPMGLAVRADKFATDLRTKWADVAVQHAKDRVIVRAKQGPYALRASLAITTTPECLGTVAEINVFRPLAGGGGGLARHGG